MTPDSSLPQPDPRMVDVHANMTGFMQEQMQRLGAAWKNGPIPDDDGTMEEIRQASVFMKMYLTGAISPFAEVPTDSPAGQAIAKTVNALVQAAEDVLVIRDSYREDRAEFKRWQASIKTIEDVPADRRDAVASYSRQMFEAVRGLDQLGRALNLTPVAVKAPLAGPSL